MPELRPDQFKAEGGKAESENGEGFATEAQRHGEARHGQFKAESEKAKKRKQEQTDKTAS